MICLTNSEGAVSRIQQLLEEKNITILSFHAENNSLASELNLEIIVKFPESFNAVKLLSLIQEDASVKAVEFQ
ncbi:hypothetical protein D3C81_2201580 [compost metagenome]